LSFVVVAGLLSMGLKHLTFLDKWVFLPLFPDVLDYLFLMVSAVWLGVVVWRRY